MERYFQRAALVTLILVVIYGFHVIGGQNERINQSRVQATKDACPAANKTTLALRRLIVAGAEGSRPFEPLYRRYGFPSYVERVRMAKKSARTLPLRDCVQAVEDARKALK